jgi:hypothetical protein
MISATSERLGKMSRVWRLALVYSKYAHCISVFNFKVCHACSSAQQLVTRMPPLSLEFNYLDFVWSFVRPFYAQLYMYIYIYIIYVTPHSMYAPACYHNANMSSRRLAAPFHRTSRRSFLGAKVNIQITRLQPHHQVLLRRDNLPILSIPSTRSGANTTLPSPLPNHLTRHSL